MKRTNSRKSLITLCIVSFVVYSMLLLLVFLSFQSWSDRKMETAFPTLEDLQVYEQYLISGEYEKIPRHKFGNCSYIIFDAFGEVAYSSNLQIRDSIHYDQLGLINDSDRNGYYTVRAEENAEGESEYVVSYEYYNQDSGFTEELGYCRLNEDLEVISGDLFPAYTELSEEEFRFIKGLYHSDESISKYQYENAQGQVMTLVFVARRYSEAAYDALLKETRQTFWMILPCTLAGTILLTYVFHRRIRKIIAALNEGIQSYRKGGTVSVDRDQIVEEFQTTLDALDQLLQELETADRERQQMIAGLSHDLKTPLSVINGCARAFADQMVPPEMTDKYMQMIIQRSQKADEMINALYDYAKMEHPDFHAHCETMDLTVYLQEFFADKYREIEMAGCDLQMELPEEEIMVGLDPKLFHRVPENLINNAIKYNPSGTMLTVGLMREQENAILTIADDGVGIGKNLAPHVFESFVTGDSARTGGRSSGLGLSIVKKIVTLHGGSVELLLPPTSNHATEFRITLPIVKKKRILTNLNVRFIGN